MTASPPRAVRLAIVAGALTLFAFVGAWLAGHGGPGATEVTSSTASDDAAPRLAATGRGPPQAATTGGTVEGLIRRDGAPAAASVTVRRPPPAPEPGSAFDLLAPPRPADPIVGEAHAGDDGAFVLLALPEGPLTLDAVSADGARGRASVEVPSEGERASVRIDLPADPHDLRGRVVTPKGAPWKGSVRVVTDLAGAPPYDVSNPHVVRATTDDAGRFEARGLFGSHVAVQALVEGSWCVAGPQARLPYRGEVRLVVPDASNAIQGIVVDDATGTPIADAVLETSTYASTSVARATSGPEGRFRLVTLERTPTIDARAAGFARARVDGDREHEVRVALRRTAVVRGRVTSDGDGRPVAGVDVFVGYSRAASTDAEGRYEVKDVVPGEVAVYARGNGWVQKGVEDVQSQGWNPFCLTVKPGGVAVADRTVVAGARAIGHVLDARGRPEGSATLFATPVAPYGDGVGPVGALLGGASAETNADGSFAMEGLVPGVAYAFTLRTGSALAMAIPVGTRVATAGAPLVLEVRSKPLATLEVRVRERPGGRPVPAASISWHLGEAWQVMGVATAGEDGVARIGSLVEGRYSVAAAAEGYVTSSLYAAQVDLADGHATVTVELERGTTLEGVVRLPDGSPAAGASVDCDTEDGGLEGQTETSDGEGRFRFEGLREGPHVLDARAAEGSGTTGTRATIPAGRREVVLTLTTSSPDSETASDAPPAGIVTVLDPSGTPVPRATLYLRAAERSGYRHWTEVVDGKATIEGTDEDGWIVEVLRPRTVGGTPLAAGVGWGLWNATSGPVTLRLPPEAPIAGTVVDAAGRPVEGVLLEAVPESIPPPDARHLAEEVVSRTRSGPGGAFVLRGTGPEAYRVAVSPPPGSAPPAPVVAQGGANGLVVRLRPGVAVTVTVLDPDGRPVPDAIVSATAGPHETYLEWPDSVVTVLNEGGLARTSAEGTVKLQGLDPEARYDLYVGRPQGGPAVLGLDTPDWRPADTTIRLPRAHKVRGTVRDGSGQPVEGAEVTLSRKGGPTPSAWTGADGSFAFDLLPAGPVTLTARVPGAEGDAEALADASATVDAGAQDVRLVLRGGADLRVRIEGLGRETRADLTREPALPDAASHSAAVHEDGSVRFRGLTAGATYVLWVEPDDQGRFAYATGLRAGPTEVVVRADSGRPLKGTVTAPAGTGRIAVHASGVGWSLWTTAGPGGRYEFPGLPAGPCHVEAQASRGPDDLSAARDAQTGDVVDLVLEKPR